jgi:alkylation response protein AidB-like acyl-CoA dehydrogenase
MPVADVTVADDAAELAAGPAATAHWEAAVDDFLVLTAAALVGIGARALEIGVEYVTERKAWGVPIGSFQSVAHRLADSATAIDGARLLAYEAAWAVEDEPPRAAELGAMAFAFAYESARDATYRSLHYHGGYGFMMEYDVQLYYRRARAWAGVYGDPKAAYRRVADRRYGPVGEAS